MHWMSAPYLDTLPCYATSSVSPGIVFPVLCRTRCETVRGGGCALAQAFRRCGRRISTLLPYLSSQPHRSPRPGHSAVWQCSQHAQQFWAPRA